MLVRFSVENYLSFRERVELSMIASKRYGSIPDTSSSQIDPRASRF